MVGHLRQVEGRLRQAEGRLMGSTSFGVGGMPFDGQYVVWGWAVDHLRGEGGRWCI